MICRKMRSGQADAVQLDVQTVALAVHLTVQGADLPDQRVDLLKSDAVYVANARTGADGRATFEVLPGAQHKLRSTYGDTWVSDSVTGPVMLEYDFD
jgi:hypothetical protein